MKTLKHSLYLAGMICIAISVSGFISSFQSRVAVTTVRVNQPMTTSASCSINVTGTPVSEMGACCWMQPDPTVTHKKFILSPTSKKGTPVLMTGLKPGTMYYVRAYAKSGNEIIYGNELTFTTAADSPNSDAGKKKEEKPTGKK